MFTVLYLLFRSLSFSSDAALFSEADLLPPSRRHTHTHTHHIPPLLYFAFSDTHQHHMNTEMMIKLLFYRSAHLLIFLSFVCRTDCNLVSSFSSPLLLIKSIIMSPDHHHHHHHHLTRCLKEGRGQQRIGKEVRAI